MTRASRAIGLSLYSQTAQQCTRRIIRQYSTSFNSATLMLPRRTRRHIANIYGLVRIADEIVDETAAEAGLTRESRRLVLDKLEEDTRNALRCGYSANVVVQAFAVTAAEAGFGAELTTPFFLSMRRDLYPVNFTTEEELDDYVYGSAEVVGLMCLAVFLHGEDVDPERLDSLRSGARSLGAAFQKVNFLRDLSNDWRRLGRSYFPHINPEAFTGEEKSAILADIDAELCRARRSIDLLPPGCQAGVRAAYEFFRALTAQLREMSTADVMNQRAHVSVTRKVSIVAGAWVGRPAKDTP